MTHTIRTDCVAVLDNHGELIAFASDRQELDSVVRREGYQSLRDAEDHGANTVAGYVTIFAEPEPDLDGEMTGMLAELAAALAQDDMEAATSLRLSIYSAVINHAADGSRNACGWAFTARDMVRDHLAARRNAEVSR